jgi:hypothetical protein
MIMSYLTKRMKALSDEEMIDV